MNQSLAHGFLKYSSFVLPGLCPQSNRTNKTPLPSLTSGERGVQNKGVGVCVCMHMNTRCRHRQVDTTASFCLFVSDFLPLDGVW